MTDPSGLTTAMIVRRRFRELLRTPTARHSSAETLEGIYGDAALPGNQLPLRQGFHRFKKNALRDGIDETTVDNIFKDELKLLDEINSVVKQYRDDATSKTAPICDEFFFHDDIGPVGKEINFETAKKLIAENYLADMTKRDNGVTISLCTAGLELSIEALAPHIIRLTIRRGIVFNDE